VLARNGLAPDELEAHTGMFSGKTNDGYYDLGLQTAKFIREAVMSSRGAPSPSPVDTKWSDPLVDSKSPEHLVDTKQPESLVDAKVPEPPVTAKSPEPLTELSEWGKEWQ
jgi:hypothetical protein